MNIELSKCGRLTAAARRLEAAHKAVAHCAETYGPTTDDPQGMTAWEAAIREIGAAERAALTELLVAYDMEVNPC